MTEQKEKEQRQHYSKARERLLRDGDWLSITECVDVLSENRKEAISRESVIELLNRWQVRKIDGPLFLYDEIRNRVVKRNRGRRALPENELSPGALRQREFKARQRAKREQERGQDGLADASPRKRGSISLV